MTSAVLQVFFSVVIFLQVSYACECPYSSVKEIPNCSDPLTTTDPDSAVEPTTTRVTTRTGETTGISNTTSEFNTTETAEVTTNSRTTTMNTSIDTTVAEITVRLASCCRNNSNHSDSQILCCSQTHNCTNACQFRDQSCESIAETGNHTLKCITDAADNCSTCTKYLNVMTGQCVDSCSTTGIVPFRFKSKYDSKLLLEGTCQRTPNTQFFLIVIIPSGAFVLIILIVGIVWRVRSRKHWDDLGPENPLPTKEDLELTELSHKSKKSSKKTGPSRTLSKPNQYAQETSRSKKVQIESNDGDYGNLGCSQNALIINSSGSVSVSTLISNQAYPETDYTDMSGIEATNNPANQVAAEPKGKPKRVHLPEDLTQPEKPIVPTKPQMASSPEEVSQNDEEIIYENNVVHKLTKALTQRQNQIRGPLPSSRESGVENAEALYYDEVADRSKERRPLILTPTDVPEFEEAYADQQIPQNLGDESDYTAPQDAIPSVPQYHYKQEASEEADVSPRCSSDELEYTAPFDGADKSEVLNEPDYANYDDNLYENVQLR